MLVAMGTQTMVCAMLSKASHRLCNLKKISTGWREENCLIPLSTQAVLMWEFPPLCYCILTVGGLPAIRIQWSLLTTTAAGHDCRRKTWQAGCTEVSRWIDFSRTSLPIDRSKFVQFLLKQPNSDPSMANIGPKSSTELLITKCMVAEV